MGHLNIIIAGGGGERRVGKKGGNLNAPIFKSLNTRGKGSLGKEAGRQRGGVPEREREEIPGEGGSPGGKLRFRIDRRKKESFSIPPNL